MAGFTKQEVPKNKIEIEDGDESEFNIKTDIDGFDGDEDIIPTKGIDSSNKSKVPNKAQQKTIKKTPKKEESNVKYIIAGVVGVVIIGLIAFSSMKLSKEKALVEKAKLQEQTNSTKGVIKDNVKVGVPNLNGTGAEKNDEKLYDPKLITKDLQGSTVPTNYVVVNNEEVIDFITYVKYRASMGNGVEFYWLDAEYKGQPYKVQVPYSVYSKLDSKGITVVDAEVLTLDNGSKMVTYMQVRKDAKALLDKNR